MADTQDLGSCGIIPVEVQVLSSALRQNTLCSFHPDFVGAQSQRGSSSHHARRDGK